MKPIGILPLISISDKSLKSKSRKEEEASWIATN